MWITANGGRYRVDAGTSVAAFVRSRSLDPEYVVVERNGEPLARERYEDVRLEDGDRIELVRAVAGGSTSVSRPRGDDVSKRAAGHLGTWRRRRLAAARLYVVTGARQGRGDLEEFLEAVLDAGTDIVQLREKDAEAGDLVRWGELFLGAAQRHQALFVVNDRPDVAAALGADGVHVGQNDLPVDATRAVVGPDALIGLSAHDEEQFRLAPGEADYLCVGPVHATPTKPGRPATGLPVVRAAASRARAGHETRPWFAIGGIDPATLPAVVEAGARRIVVVRAVTEAHDPAEAVAALTEGLPPA